MASKGRWVTEEELMTAVNRRIAAIAQSSASDARATGREEAARMWEGFVVKALAKVPLEDKRARLREAVIVEAKKHLSELAVCDLGSDLDEATRALVAFEEGQTP